MSERNVSGGVTAVFLTELLEFLYPMRWFGLLALIIILVDLRFGTLAAVKRGEVVRFSRAIRRTGNKIVDYLCWLLLASAFGLVFGEPFGFATLREIILFVIFGAELQSCFTNYFAYRGLNIKVDIFKFFKAKADIIEVEEQEPNKKENVKNIKNEAQNKYKDSGNAGAYPHYDGMLHSEGSHHKGESGDHPTSAGDSGTDAGGHGAD